MKGQYKGIAPFKIFSRYSIYRYLITDYISKMEGQSKWEFNAARATTNSFDKVNYIRHDTKHSNLYQIYRLEVQIGKNPTRTPQQTQTYL